MDEEARGRTGIQVIARAAKILRALESEKSGLSISEIAKRVDLPRSTVQRIVTALASEHLLILAARNSKASLGPAILRMASNTGFDFANFVHPHLELLAQRIGETVDLSVPRGDKMIFVDQIPANHRLSAVSAIGSSFPAFSSANGKAALSLLSDDAVRKLLSDGMFQETPNTVTSFSELLKYLEIVRSTKIAIDDQEHSEGVSALGTAFHDPLGRIFAVSVPVPTIRFKRSKGLIIEALLNFREELERSIN